MTELFDTDDVNQHSARRSLSTFGLAQLRATNGDEEEQSVA